MQVGVVASDVVVVGVAEFGTQCDVHLVEKGYKQLIGKGGLDKAASWQWWGVRQHGREPVKSSPLQH